MTEKSELILDGIKISKPADYKPVPPYTLPGGRTSTINDVAEFVGRFISDNHLGLLSNARLVLSDISDNGPGDEDALKLSEACSLAVDFPKSGINADLSELPGKVDARPDWMRPLLSSHFPDRRGEFYTSNRLLGDIYRNADPQELDFSETPIINNAIRTAVTKWFKDQNLHIQWEEILYKRSTEIFFTDTYQPLLWSIYEEGQLCTNPMDEIDLYLLNNPGDDNMGPDHIRVSIRVKALVDQVDAFFLDRINRFGSANNNNEQMTFFYYVW